MVVPGYKITQHHISEEHNPIFFMVHDTVSIWGVCCWMAGWLVNKVLERMWKEVVMVWSLTFAWWVWRKWQKLSVKLAGVPAKIQTKHLLNSLKSITHSFLCSIMILLSYVDRSNTEWQMFTKPEGGTKHLFKLMHFLSPTLSNA